MKKNQPETPAHLPAAVADFGAEVAVMSNEVILSGYTFAAADPLTYVRNIRILTARTKAAQKEAVCATVVLGRYCRDAGHDLKAKGMKGEFGDWLRKELPEVPYSAIATAMRIAGDLAKKHPELRTLDTPEKIEQLTHLIDDQSLTAFGRSLREREDEGNVVPETGKRVHFPPKKSPSPQEQAAAAEEERKANFLAAVDTLAQVVDEGAHGALTDDELRQATGVLRDQTEKLAQHLAERAAGKKPKPKAGDIDDL